MNDARLISKREFLRALDCRTMAYLDREQDNAMPGAALRWRFYEGNRIGQMARTMLGAGRLLPMSPREVALTHSAHAIQDAAASVSLNASLQQNANGAGTDASQRLYECTVSGDGLIARADALIRHPEGWELVEVKSAKMPEKGIAKPDHVDDVAFTMMVAQAAGVPIVRASLMLMSREYMRGASEPLGLIDVTEAARARAAEFTLIAPAIIAALTGGERPAPALMQSCKSCDFFARVCIGQGIDDSILRIPRLSAKRFDEIRSFERIRNVPDSVEFTATQTKTIDVIRNRAVYTDATVLARLERIVWPVRYLDFEAVMPALPWFDGDTPYTTMPNQYSIHTAAQPGDALTHAEYLAEVGIDWRRDLVVRLVSDLGESGSIVVYSPYERTQLNALAQRFPEFATRIEAVVQRLIDLEPIIREGYVHHRFAGSSSIKQVLPVLVPSLSYDALAVANGNDAAGVFSLMWVNEIPSDEHERIRRALLDYCALDTLAMVRLHEALLAL